MAQKTCIIIAGPTAVGKTSVSLELAKHFKTAIISADSRQCYKELNIGVAKPDALQLEQVQHYFINSHSVTDEVNAAVFEQYALNAVQEIFREHPVAIMVGGTGLYIRAFCEGMDEIPPVPAGLRNEISLQYNLEGLAWLQKEIKKKDPNWYAAGEIQNPQRIMRALEVVMATGKSILDFHRTQKKKRGFNIIRVGLTLPRPQLYYQVNTRVDAMIRDGLEDEVRSLTPYRTLNALQTVGYKELFDYLDGEIDREKAIQDIKRNTRHYAKRQLTWFAKDDGIKWYSPLDLNQLINYFHSLVRELQ
ncbi:MAG: tRNA (adenosine(37)-N6)-dimethylallyltransferase MiaA [Bacteroidota bacterium]